MSRKPFGTKKRFHSFLLFKQVPQAHFKQDEIEERLAKVSRLRYGYKVVIL
jgi:hypothetical protein